MVTTRAMHVAREHIRDSDSSVQCASPHRSKDSTEILEDASEASKDRALSQTSKRGTPSFDLVNSRDKRTRSDHDMEFLAGYYQASGPSETTKRGTPQNDDVLFVRMSPQQESRRIKFFEGREFIVEKLVKFASETSTETDFKDMLVRNNLKAAVSDLPKFIPEVVKEFYANLPEEKHRGKSVRLSVRGFLYEFSPEKINEELRLDNLTEAEVLEEYGLPLDKAAKALSAGKTGDYRALNASDFSTPIANLYTLMCTNWIPTSNPVTMRPDRVKLLYKMVKGLRFDLGRLIYKEIRGLGVKKSDKFNLLYPCLIFKVLESQGFECSAQEDQYQVPSRFLETKINVFREPNTKPNVSQVRRTTRLAASEKGKAVASPSPRKKHTKSAKKRAGVSKKNVVVEEISTTDDDEEVSSSEMEFDEFVVRIPKKVPGSIIRQAIRSSINTFQSFVDAFSRSSKH